MTVSLVVVVTSPYISWDWIEMPVDAHEAVVRSGSAKAVLEMVTLAPMGPVPPKSHAEDTQPPPTLVEEAMHETVLRNDRCDVDAEPSEMVSETLVSAVEAVDTTRSPVYARLGVQEVSTQLLMGSTGCMVVRAVM